MIEDMLLDDDSMKLSFLHQPPVYEYMCHGCKTKVEVRHIRHQAEAPCTRVSNWFVQDFNSNVRIVLPTWMKPS